MATGLERDAAHAKLPADHAHQLEKAEATAWQTGTQGDMPLVESLLDPPPDKSKVLDVVRELDGNGDREAPCCSA